MPLRPSFELLRLVREEAIRPDLVIALPVGFVGAAESKERLILEGSGLGLDFIANRGRRGLERGGGGGERIADNGGREVYGEKSLRHGYTRPAPARRRRARGCPWMLRELPGNSRQQRAASHR